MSNVNDTENGAIKDPAEWTTGEEPMTGAYSGSRLGCTQAGMSKPTEDVLGGDLT
jgi:Protein of unknown function (DUF3072)